MMLGTLSLAAVSVLFVCFVVVMMYRGWKAQKRVREDLRREMQYNYTQMQRRHTKKYGRMSSELANARPSHLKVVGGQASATK